MAYIMERLLTIDFKESADYPYCSAERIVEYEYLSLERIKLNVLALCDCSLMFTNPAHIFYDILKNMKQKKYLPSNRKIYMNNYVMQKLASEKTKTDVFSHYNDICEEARKKLKSYF